MGRHPLAHMAMMLSLVVMIDGPSLAVALSDNHVAGPVAATVNDAYVLVSEVDGLVVALTRQYPSIPKADLRRQVVNRLVERKLIVQAAIKQGLDKDPVVLSRLGDMQQDLLQEVYLSRRAEIEITEEVLRAAYEESIAGLPDKIEVHARHILLKDEDAAKAIITQLEGGADFADLATEHSTGPSAERGGDLGFFPREAMVAPFSDAAFALDAGAYTALPVKTQFGWHVIKVEVRRTAPGPTLEESVDRLSGQLIGKMVDDLRAAAKITINESVLEPN